METELSGANNLKSIRELAAKSPDLRREVLAAVEPPKELLNNVFERLHLKGKVFKVFSAATPEEMKELADNLKKIDSECDINLFI